MFVYDPQAESWTEKAVYWTEGKELVHACVHNGRMVVFTKNGLVFEHIDGPLTDTGDSPHWFPAGYGVDGRGLIRFVSESVLLG